MENGFRVLIAACDTFRAGAVEQLRTHTHKLNALHPPEKHAGQKMVQLYEKGYGKDAAGIAMEAINYGKLGYYSSVLCFISVRKLSNILPLYYAALKETVTYISFQSSFNVTVYKQYMYCITTRIHRVVSERSFHKARETFPLHY